MPGGVDPGEHEQLLSLIYDHDSTGIAIVSGPDLVLRSANPAFFNLITHVNTPERRSSLKKVTPQSHGIGRPYEQLWTSNFEAPGVDKIRQVMRGNGGQGVEWLEVFDSRLKPRSFWLCLNGVQWQGERAVLILMQDVTQIDRVKNLALEIAEEAHRRSEELNAVIMAMTDILMICDSSGQAIRTNLAAFDVLGIDPVGMEQGELIDLLSIQQENGLPVALEDLPSTRARMGEVVTGERVYLINKLGQEMVFLISASPLYSEAGISGVVSVWHDVTAREHLLDQLEIEQSRLKTIIENAPEAILVADEDGRLVLSNPAAVRILTRAPRYEQDYDTLKELEFCYPDGTPYQPRNLPLVCSALDGTRHSNVEMMIRRPDGNHRFVLASTAPIIDRKGNLNGSVGVLQDITLRKRAEDELRTQAAQSQMLASLSQAFAEAGLKSQELLDTIVDQIGAISGDICAIQLVSGSGEWISLAAFKHPDPLVRAAVLEKTSHIHLPAAGELGASGQVVRIVDASAEEIDTLLSPSCRLFLENFFIANGLIIPLRSHGRWIGSLGLFRSEPGRRYTMEDQFFYQDLADRAALAIEGAMLYEHEIERARELHALQQATSALLSTIDLEALLVQILESAQQAIPAANKGVLYLLAPDTGSLEFRASMGFTDSRIRYGFSQNLQSHISRAVSEGKPILIHRIPDPPQDEAAPGEEAARSAVIAPLTHGKEVLGAICLVGPQVRLFEEGDLQMLSSFAATATAALNNATLYAEVQRLATTDALTGQYNRRRFFELGELEMHRFRRFKQPLSAIMLDLDHFKEINDIYGHAGGDEALIQVGRRVRASIRVIDFVGRYGGDEFAILLPDASIEEAGEIAERIRQSVTSETVITPQGKIDLSISLGIAQARDETETLSSLLVRADDGLYAAKQNGRNCVGVAGNSPSAPASLPGEG